MPTQIAFKGVHKSYASRGVVLQNVSFTVRPGEHVGVVGENGAGKSTLLRLIAGVEAPDEGQVTVTGNLGYLSQTLDLPTDWTVSDAIDAALAELRAMGRRLRELEHLLSTASPADGAGAADNALLTEYGELLSAYELRGGYEADVRVDKAIHALSLAHITRERTLGSLSGGEQARLRLACLVAAAPEVMVLDEPTNHLDEAALTWLEDRLREHRGTIVVVCHDRVFLERVATAILEVDGDRRTVVRYGDGYAGFLAEKAAARQRWEQAYARWCDEIAHLSRYAATTARRVAPGRPMKDRNKPAYDRDAERVASSVASRVRNAQERLRRLRENPVPRPPDPLRFQARFTGAAQGRIELSQVAVGTRLAVEHFEVSPGDRILIFGPNGAGKSTLLRLCAGQITPDRGVVTRDGVIGYLPQEIPARNDARPLVAAFGAGLPGTIEEHTDRLLSLGLFRPEDLRMPVGRLSAGQRRRLALAALLVRRVDLLLLDEPTNHISLALVEELEEALDSYPGGLVVVSHDRRFRARFSGVQYELRAGRLVV